MGNTNDDICLTKTRDGRQFGPSVLAPFSKVTLTNSGFIDGIVIAKEFTTVTDSGLGTEQQLHGATYNGEIECIEPSLTNTNSGVTNSNLAPEPKEEECNCGKGVDMDQSWRCGDRIYVCPNVEKVCSTHANVEVTYYSLTQDECNTMKNVGIGERCIPLPHHGIKKGKKLGNRVCYNSTGNSEHGMKQDGTKCKFCKDSFSPIFEN